MNTGDECGRRRLAQKHYEDVANLVRRRCTHTSAWPRSSPAWQAKQRSSREVVEERRHFQQKKLNTRKGTLLEGDGSQNDTKYALRRYGRFRKTLSRYWRKIQEKTETVDGGKGEDTNYGIDQSRLALRTGDNLLANHPLRRSL